MHSTGRKSTGRRRPTRVNLAAIGIIHILHQKYIGRLRDCFIGSIEKSCEQQQNYNRIQLPVSQKDDGIINNY